MNARTTVVIATSRCTHRRQLSARLLSAVSVLAFALVSQQRTRPTRLLTGTSSPSTSVQGGKRRRKVRCFRALAIMHVAMSERASTPFRTATPAHALDIPGEFSGVGRVRGCGRRAWRRCVVLAPSQKAKVDEVVRCGACAHIPPNRAGKVAGIAVGEQAAAAVIAERADDGTDVARYRIGL